jgi:AdoMet-dependent heme synthase
MLILAWEITAACNLCCSYCCRAAACALPDKDELTLDEARRLIDEAAPLKPMLILSGGEPLMRPDIFDIIDYAVSRGLRVSLATNGTLLTPDIVFRIKEAGVSRVSISLDGPTPETHDVTRGQGCYQRALSGMELLRSQVDFQINVTITRRNQGDVVPMLDLGQKLGARALHFFFLVPTGRGNVRDIISVEKQEELLTLINEESSKRSMEIRVTCAPQYARRGSGGGCLAGRSFAFISRRGEVFPCGYMPVLVGNVREKSFAEIWETSHVFTALRDRKLKGNCGSCRYKMACGGCRARAYAESGDFLGQDPLCPEASCG